MFSRSTIVAVFLAGLACLLAAGCASRGTDSTAYDRVYDFSPGSTASMGAGDFVGCQVYVSQNPEVLVAVEREMPVAELDTGD